MSGSKGAAYVLMKKGRRNSRSKAHNKINKHTLRTEDHWSRHGDRDGRGGMLVEALIWTVNKHEFHMDPTSQISPEPNLSYVFHVQLDTGPGRRLPVLPRPLSLVTGFWEVRPGIN